MEVADIIRVTVHQDQVPARMSIVELMSFQPKEHTTFDKDEWRARIDALKQKILESDDLGWFYRNNIVKKFFCSDKNAAKAVEELYLAGELTRSQSSDSGRGVMYHLASVPVADTLPRSPKDQRYMDQLEAKVRSCKELGWFYFSSTEWMFGHSIESRRAVFEKLEKEGVIQYKKVGKHSQYRIGRHIDAEEEAFGKI